MGPPSSLQGVCKMQLSWASMLREGNGCLVQPGKASTAPLCPLFTRRLPATRRPSQRGLLSTVPSAAGTRASHPDALKFQSQENIGLISTNGRESFFHCGHWGSNFLGPPRSRPPYRGWSRLCPKPWDDTASVPRRPLTSFPSISPLRLPRHSVSVTYST